MKAVLHLLWDLSQPGADRVTGLCGLAPARVERYDVIAVAEGAAGIGGVRA
jgi:hypothetical protein